MVDEAEAIYKKSVVIDMRGMPSLTSEVGVSRARLTSKVDRKEQCYSTTGISTSSTM